MSDNIFAKAAELLMTKGHIKGHLRTDQGYCAIGALCTAWESSGLDYDHDYIHAARLAEARLAARPEGIPARNENGLAPLALWNDAPERSAEDVILLFKELAAEEDG